MIKKVVRLLILLTAASALILPSIHSLSNTPTRKRIPFVGMTLSYQVYENIDYPPMFPRMVTFYGDPLEPNYIWVRDSLNTPENPNDDRVWQIDVVTRKVAGEEYYSEPLFPANLHIGDEVITYWGGPVTIIGSQRMSLMGKHVDAWIAYADVGWGHYTMYYEKKTGIWLGGNFVWYDGEKLNSFAMHLVSTNVPLFEED